MKAKIISILLMAVIIVVSCQKEDPNTPAVKQDVSFGITETGPGNLKNDTIECPVNPITSELLIPTVAEIVIGGKSYHPQVFYLNGKLYTQAIKLEPGTYTVTKFLLLTEAGGTIVMATPENGAAFADYVSPTVPFNITVDPFIKTEVDIEVLCFIEQNVQAFGFFWFHITEIVVREFCFFGDLCVKNPDEYLGSLYANQSTGLQIDMPAIFEMRVYKDGVELPTSPFTNATADAGWGIGAPLCVQYPDNLSVEEEFEFELWILVRVGNDFDYVHFHTWTVTDDEEIKDGDDGVVDFVLGNCNYSNTDLLLPPYMNLPQTANVTIHSPGDPGYWDFTINSVSPNAPNGSYDILSAGTMTGWCGDKTTTINNNTTWTMYLYSSLYEANWPAGVPFDGSHIAKINWLFNNIGSFAGFNQPSGMHITSGDFTQAQGLTIQNAIWGIIHGTSGVSGMALNMATAASPHGSFTPLPGGWAAILFIPNNNPQEAQILFSVVDP